VAPEAPALGSFLSAASKGRLLWVVVSRGSLEVCSGSTPPMAASDQIGRLFVAALREHFGEAASAVAEVEWCLTKGPRRLLPARTARCAAACAESALSLFMAQSCVWRFEFSAVLLGWRFRQVAEGLGLDAAALSLERRQVLDQAMTACFERPHPADVDGTAARLRTLLTKGLH
jgi:hypothetical protein